MAFEIVPVKGDKPCIIFDWDDTLFPSRWTSDTPEVRKYLRDRQATPELTARLNAYYVALTRLITHAKHVGQVVIVTNGQKGWFESCLDLFPYLKNVFVGIPVYSARSCFEGPLCQTPDEWKRAAFRKILEIPARDMSLCVVSVGDSNCERQAIWDVTGSPPPNEVRIATSGLRLSKGDPRYSVRSIKLAHYPSIEQLTEQLEMVDACLDKVIASPIELDLEMSPKVPKVPKVENPVVLP